MDKAHAYGDEILCPVCLNIFETPVSIPCGHSFCEKCITQSWDLKEDEQPYSCPVCKERFRNRPQAYKNFALNTMIKKIKKITINLPKKSYVQPKEGFCVVCNRVNSRAITICLTCLASYCETHIQPHMESEALKAHKLNEPDTKLQKVCAVHGKPLDLFCKFDRKIICSECSVTRHKGHNIELAMHTINPASTSGECVQKEILEIQQEENLNLQSSIFNFLSDTKGLIMTTLGNAAGSFLSSLREKIGTISKQTDNEGFPHLKMVLVGRCGIGKSTLFNSVVVKEGFMIDPSKQSATEHCEIFHGVRDGRHITVIDTPGFFSSHFSNEQVSDKIQTDVKMAPPGHFLFLLMVEVDNYTQEDTETANIIEKILDGSIANMMVVFTQGCRLKSTIEEYVQGSDENLKKLLEKCEQRCLVLNNTAMNLQHLKELFKINDQLIQKDGFWKDGNMEEEAERVSKRKGSLDIVPPANDCDPACQKRRNSLDNPPNL